MSKSPSKNPSDWKFKRFRIEPELISQIENLANVRGEQKGDIIAETMEWFIKNRSDGSISPRYFASPNEAPYTGIWVTPDTAKKIDSMAQTDSQNSNRVIYTAIARYIDKDKT